MTADFLKYFEGSEYDSKIILKKDGESYSVYDIKKIIAPKAAYLRTLNSSEIAIGECSNFDFIINFLSCVFAKKNIVLKNFTESLEIPDITKLCIKNSENRSDFDFEAGNPSEIMINLFTSGSSATPKNIQKTLKNLIKEAEDLKEEFAINENLEFIATTTPNHLYGLVFYLILPLNSGGVINSNSISYPENLTIENACLITSPSFLEKMEKYSEKPLVKPLKIFAAGAKFKEETLNYAKSISGEVIDIYGSTETGTIGYRCSAQEPLKLLKNIRIKPLLNGTEIETPYSFQPIQIIGDRIEVLDGRTIKLLGRADRILKIQEKRLSAEEVENTLNKHEFLKKSYVLQNGEKLACIAVLNNAGIDFLINSGSVELIKILKNYLRKSFEILPQKWKFLDEIPKTSNGKTDKQKIENLFNLNLSFPLVLEKKYYENSADIKLCFYRNCNFFKGHFEGYPILPGVVQLFYAQYFAKDAFGINCTAGQIRRMKFAGIIYPDKIINLNLEFSENKITFKYHDDKQTYSSGNLPVKNILEGVV